MQRVIGRGVHTDRDLPVTVLAQRARVLPGHARGGTAVLAEPVVAQALAQLPAAPGYRTGKKVLTRTDGAGGTHDLLDHPTKRRLAYSIGFGLTDTMTAAAELIPADVWTPICDADGKVRDGAWDAELTGLVDLSGWPDGMRIIVRKEWPHPARNCGSPTQMACG
ncbi:hypothetical protein M2280_006319 [Prescottella agglutinans]|uniref:Transposase DDE domain-containing protein n=1 Tax=Prescottella agglutinans TaxID=1644129 RepID=A0ABT6MLD5_9NOCA|nr:hypothetical protein [Prescottella agglutinans]